MGNSCLRHFLKLFRERNRIHRSIFVHVQECMQSRYMVYCISLILPKASFFLDSQIPSSYLHVNKFVSAVRYSSLSKSTALKNYFIFACILCSKKYVYIPLVVVALKEKEHILWFVCQNQRNSQNANGCKNKQL